MSTDVLTVPYVVDTRPVVGTPHPDLVAQQLTVDHRARLLRRAQASGHRLVGALFLVLDRHDAESVVTADGLVHLRCVECRPDLRAPADQYPCPTAQQALWALDAVLSLSNPAVEQPR